MSSFTTTSIVQTQTQSVQHSSGQVKRNGKFTQHGFHLSCTTVLLWMLPRPRLSGLLTGRKSVTNASC